MQLRIINKNVTDHLRASLTLEHVVGPTCGQLRHTLGVRGIFSSVFDSNRSYAHLWISTLLGVGT